MKKYFAVLISLIIVGCITTGCSDNVKPSRQINNIPNDNGNISTTTNPPATSNPMTDKIGTKEEPLKIIVYNQNRTAVFEKGTDGFERLTNYIYEMLNRNSENDNLRLAIKNGDVSQFKQGLAVEFLYNSPVEFIYPNKYKRMVTKFLIAPASKQLTVFTDSTETGLYMSGPFIVHVDSSYEQLIKKYVP